MSQVCSVSMSEWPEEGLHSDDEIVGDVNGALSVRDVNLYLGGRGKLWIHAKDVDWLVRSRWIQQQLTEVADVRSDDEGPDAPKSMEPEMTPEKCPEPRRAAGHLHDKWATAP